MHNGKSCWKAEASPLPRMLKHKTSVNILKFINKLLVGDFDTENVCKHQWTILTFFLFNLMPKKRTEIRRDGTEQENLFLNTFPAWITSSTWEAVQANSSKSVSLPQRQNDQNSVRMAPKNSLHHSKDQDGVCFTERTFQNRETDLKCAEISYCYPMTENHNFANSWVCLGKNNPH